VIQITVKLNRWPILATRIEGHPLPPANQEKAMNNSQFEIREAQFENRETQFENREISMEALDAVSGGSMGSQVIKNFGQALQSLGRD
jgi:hypothetical protein